MDREKLTIILLPGLHGTEGLFKPLIECKPDSYDTLVVSFPTQDTLSYSELTACVLKKINHLKGEFILVGESFSGPLALFVAQTRPENLKGVILVASFIAAPHTRLLRFLPWEFLFRSIKVFSSLANNNSVFAMACRELEIVNSHVLSKRIESIFDVNAEYALKNFPVPIMYFRGKRDFVVPAKNLRRIENVKSNIHIIEFDSDHFLLQRVPSGAWTAISQFVQANL